MSNQPLKIRLWGKAPGNNFLTPASFASSLENPELFIRCLNDLEHGWILTYDYIDPNRLKPEELIKMAREIIEHNGVKLLSVGQDQNGNKIWLSQNFAEYEQRLLTVDWSRIGQISAPVSKPVHTEKRDALEAVKAKIEAIPPTIPPAIVSMAKKYDGSGSIPKPLLTKLEEWYKVDLVDNQYKITEKNE